MILMCLILDTTLIPHSSSRLSFENLPFVVTQVNRSMCNIRVHVYFNNKQSHLLNQE
jgi:hypothetical protein